MKYQILIQIYIIKIQTILNGRIVKENYWIKRYKTACLNIFPERVNILMYLEPGIIKLFSALVMRF